MPGGSVVAALVREHVGAFNARDVERLMRGLTDDVVWSSGADLVVGRERVEEFVRDAMDGLAPTLRIRSLVADEVRAACELVETYRYEGAERRVSIAAFFEFVGGRISVVKVYQEGSADP
jgi:uncharacterized protein